MGNSYGLVFLILYGGYTLILASIVAIGVFLIRRGQRLTGAVCLGVLVLWCVIPPALDRVAEQMERRVIDAANALPQELSFADQNVLIIEAGNTICDALCGDILGLGIPGDFYWIGIGHLTGESDVPNPDFALLNHGDEILRVRLGAPVPDLGGRRFAEPAEGTEIPPFDRVIIDDDGYLRSFAPNLLGLPPDLLARAQIARVVLDGWADPFADPPPEPIYRSVAPWSDVRAFVYWPLSRDDAPYPPLEDVDAAWSALLCAQAGPEPVRDAFTYAFLCDQDRLAEILN